MDAASFEMHGLLQLAMLRKKLGADHPSTLTIMNNLAFTWKEQGRDAEAVGLMKECVRLQQWILGADHRHFISSSIALATSVGKNTKKNDDAQPCK